MKKTDIEFVPSFYQGYIDKAPEKELMEALKTGGVDLYENNFDKLKQLGTKVYAPNKWTVNQMVEHLMDTERIFVNRSLRFARNDKTELPGYDHDIYVQNSRSNEIPLGKLVDQYKQIRKGTIATFENFNNEELMRVGVANGNKISVLTMGFILIGHPIHHYNVLEEKYFPLITQ